MTDGPHRIELPDEDEPAVRHPGLQMLVDAARAQPTPLASLDAETLHAAWRAHRARRRARIATLAVAAAVLLGLAALTPRLLEPTPSPSESSGTVAETREPAPPTTQPSSDRAPETTVTPEDAPPRLAAGVEVTRLPGTDPAAAVEITGAHALRLPAGEWSVDSHVSETVEVGIPDGTLELHGGHVQVRVAADVAHAEVLRDEVIHVDLEGRRTPLHPGAPTDAATPSRARPTAEALAAEAEAHLAAGDRAQAIASLRRLVTTYPRSATARTGLIDLGRLLEASGRKDEARCAYAVFLERWPGHALSGDVSRASTALGEGPACKGLRPQR